MKVSRASAIGCFSFTATASVMKRDGNYASAQASSNWHALGCYTDNVSGRTLPSGAQVPGGADAMTNEACQTACAAVGYSIAGTEYGGECWCGNAIGSGGGPAADGNAGCNMACNGKSSETCGGPNRLTVYQKSSGGTSPPSSGTGKRGLAYNNNNPSANSVYANLFKGYDKVSWGYDWGYPSWDLDSWFEFVPMLWGKPSGPAPDWTAAVKTPGTKHILGFNEPDLTYDASSNIKPADAAAGQKEFLQPFHDIVKVGTPSVLWNNYDGSSSGGNYNSRVWTKYFMGNCTSCHFDFAAIHYYQDCEPAGGQDGAAWFKSNVTDAHQTLGLPIWVTEFQCYGSEAQQIKFLQNVMPWMDAQSYVDRYAYFGTFPDFLLNHEGTELSALGKAYATT